MKREFILEFVIREFYVDGEKWWGRERSRLLIDEKNYSLIFLWIKYEFILKFIIRDFYIDGKLKNMGNKKKRVFFFIAVTNLIFFRIANV